MKTIFDIETIAYPVEQLEGLIPPFDPDSVKLGNTKDPEKVKLKIEEAQQKHRSKWIQDAALDARCSRAKLAGFLDADSGDITIYAHEENGKAFDVLRKYSQEVGVILVCKRDEASFLRAVWDKLIDSTYEDAKQIIGYFINDFDLPFLTRRAWIAGVAASTRQLRKGRYWRDCIVDLYEVWGMGEKFPSTGGLAGLAKTLNCPSAKTGDGMMFGELYAKDPAEGLAYLIGDLRTTAECAERMGVL